MELKENNGLISNVEDSPFISDEQFSMIKSSLFAARKWILFLSFVGGNGIIAIFLYYLSQLLHPTRLSGIIVKVIIGILALLIIIFSILIVRNLFKHADCLREYEKEKDTKDLLQAFVYYSKFWKLNVIFLLGHIGFWLLFFLSMLLFMAK
mgnify:CR=1 FL=1